MVVNPRFAVGILMLSVVVLLIQVFPVLSAISGCRSSDLVAISVFQLAKVYSARFAVGTLENNTYIVFF